MSFYYEELDYDDRWSLFSFIWSIIVSLFYISSFLICVALILFCGVYIQAVYPDLFNFLGDVF